MYKHLHRGFNVFIGFVLFVTLSAGTVKPVPASLPSPAPAALLIIHGKVVNAPAGGRVQAVHADGTLASATYIGPDGEYAFPPLPNEPYTLQVLDAHGRPLPLAENSQALVRPAAFVVPRDYILIVSVPPSTTPPAPVPPPPAEKAHPQTATGTGQITGTVTAAEGGAALDGAWVYLYDSPTAFSWTDVAWTDPSGVYTFTGLADGNYYLKFEMTDYVTSFYNNRSSLADADPVTVASGGLTDHIDAALHMGGQITGTVTAAQGGAGLDGASVYLYASQTAASYDYLDMTFTGSSGVYTFTGLAAGNYYLKFQASDYLTAYYNDRSSLATADPVFVALNTVTDHIDAALDMGGQITGTVTATLGGATLQDVLVYVYDSQTASSYDYIAYAYTDASGVYTVTGLAAGNDYLRFYLSGYLSSYYNGKASLAQANAVPVSLNTVTKNINASLDVGGKISGKVTAVSGGAALQGVYVYAYDSPTASDYDYISYTSTDATGAYTLSGLATGNYYLKFAKTDYLTSYYDNHDTLASADPVPTALNTETRNINAALNMGGKITGKVTAADGGAALQSVSVYLYNNPAASEYGYIDYASTDAGGVYTFTELVAGSYYLKFSKTDYITSYYNNKDTLANANAVPVALNAVADDINAALHKGGQITGQVTAAQGGASLQNATVLLYDSPTASDYGYIDSASTDAGGVYTFTGLAAGNYYLKFEKTDYIPLYYNNRSSLAAADAVNVTLDHVTPNINAALILGGKITGTVTAAQGGAPLQNATAYVYDSRTASTYGYVAYANTDATGVYTVTGLPAGNYYVGFSKTDYIPVYYDHRSSLANADAVPVTLNAVTDNISAALDLGGKITGTVTAAAGGSPMQDVGVYAYTSPDASSYDYVATANTDATGVYTVTGLPAGNYYLRFSKTDYVTVFYNNKATLAAADAVSVALNSVRDDINASLQFGGKITGQVTAAQGGASLQDVGVYVYSSRAASSYDYDDFTDATGAYAVTGLPAGTYYVRFSPPSDANYLPQYYQGQAMLAAADPVSVTLGAETGNINAALLQGGKITGQVTAAENGAPLKDVDVSIYAHSLVCGTNVLRFVNSAVTDSSGNYTVSQLPSGTYLADFSPLSYGVSAAYLEIYYNQKPDLSSADPIGVTAAGITPNINAALTRGGTIKGQVTAADGGAPLKDVDVNVNASAGSFWGWGYTDDSGNYTVTGLPAGAYKVEFDPSSGGPSAAYVSEYYNDKTTWIAADPVNVALGAVADGINAILAHGGQFTGLVTAADGGAPLTDVDVTAYDSHGNWVAGGWTDSSGVYTTTGLPTGSYRLWFSPYGSDEDYLSEYYNHRSTLSSADPVGLTAPGVSTVNTTLTRGGSISGTVTSSLTGKPLEDVTVSVLDGSDNVVTQTSTDADGHYQVRGLPTGTYRVYFDLVIYCLDFNIYYHQKPSFGTADPVSVTAPADTPGIDAQLPVPGEYNPHFCYLPFIKR